MGSEMCIRDSVPVPGTTSGIGGLGVVEVREDALSFLEVVSLVARGTVSVGSMSLALIRNGGTNIFSIENPSVRAGKADLLVPVRGRASRVGGFGIVAVSEDALSFLEVISLEA